MKKEKLSRIVTAGAAAISLGLAAACSSSSPASKDSDELCTHCGMKLDKEISPGLDMFNHAAAEHRSGKNADAAFKSAFELLQKEAEAGNLKSRVTLGVMCEHGIGTKQDSIAAARNYRIAADAGYDEGKYELASFWVDNGMNLEDALKYANELIQTTPSNVKYYALRGMILYLQGNNKQGFEDFKKVFSLEGTTRSSYEVRDFMLAYADKLIENRNLAAADRELENMKYLLPQDVSIHLYLGSVDMQAGKPQEALEHINKAIELSPADPYAYKQRAVINAYHLQKYEDAIDDIKVAIAAAPQDTHLVTEKMRIEAMSGHEDAALKTADCIIKANKEDTAEAYAMCGYIKVSRKEYDGAIEALSKAIEKDPESPENHSYIATCYAQKGDMANAEKNYRKAYELSGKSPVFMLDLAEFLIISGKSGEALSMLSEDSVKNIEHYDIKTLAAYLRTVALMVQDKDSAADEKQLEELMKTERQKNTGFSWDTTLFESWLKKSSVDAAAKQKIETLTARIKEKFAKPEPKSEKK